MTAQQRPTGRRGPSMQWSRLKSAPVDPLEAYGLPSKGETRLNDFRAQESYYNKIVERYMKFCAGAGGADKLEKQFEALYLANDALATPAAGAAAKKVSTVPPKAANISVPKYVRPSLNMSKSAPISVMSNMNPSTKRDPSQTLQSPSIASRNSNVELEMILSAMRKLREGILSSHRVDRFAQRAYIFIIHASILSRAWESYLPALLHLLQAIHEHTPLTTSEFNEFAGLHILDIACRQGDLATAFRKKSKVEYGYHDPTGRVDSLLKALVMDDWVTFWRLSKRVEGYQKRIMEFKEEEIRLHALKCIGRSYFNAERSFIEKCTGRSWEQLVKMNGVGWELQGDGEKVTIRTPRLRR
ncbi:hypothetical protein IWX90DRAFT_467733 [Phyllosticta citrichinensis]|uniref:Sac3 ganp nin1 mts3 eif-3 p25 protein n=1 Tax=Phyllosticta citrichinensis TaxID=1130410 RepID=A0ABR1XJ62_9PEZI